MSVTNVSGGYYDDGDYNMRQLKSRKDRIVEAFKNFFAAGKEVKADYIVMRGRK